MKDRSSRSYNAYPDPNSPNITEDARIGVFSDLVLCVGLAFQRMDKNAVKALCSTGSGRVLLWPPSVLEKVNKVKFAGCSSIEDKQLHMVGYLFELFYDLLIEPAANVSQSPGFETCLGIFGGSSD